MDEFAREFTAAKPADPVAEGLKETGRGLKKALLGFKKSRIIKWLKIAVAVGSAMTAVVLFLWSLQFPIFFFEESDQKMSFSAFNAVGAQQWGLVMEICDAMSANRDRANAWINAIGWVHPVAKEAYRSYFNMATPLYIRSLQAAAAAGGYTDAPAPAISPAILAGGSLPAPGITILAGEPIPPPQIDGAIMYDDPALGQYVGSGQEVTVIVPIAHFQRRTTSSGNPMGDCQSDGNFKLISYATSVIGQMSQWSGHWVAVCGEVVRWQQYLEIVVGSMSQVIQVSPYTAAPG